MGVKDILSKVFSSGAKEVITSTMSGLDALITSKEELGAQTISLEELKLERVKAEQNFTLAMGQQEIDTTRLLLADKESAREMYAKDSSLQKIFALTFLIGYLFISAAFVTMVMSWFGVSKKVLLENYEVSLLTMVFTAISTKINTITDFLFGGSQDGAAERRMMKEIEERQKTLASQ